MTFPTYGRFSEYSGSKTDLIVGLPVYITGHIVPSYEHNCLTEVRNFDKNMM